MGSGGTALARNSSPVRIGVIINCSIVAISFSRTIAAAGFTVSAASAIIGEHDTRGECLIGVAIKMTSASPPPVLGLATRLTAALCMRGSSLLVIGNSFRFGQGYPS
jgi:hypothetical protein